MFCQNCGKEIDAGAKFCKYCGTPVLRGPHNETISRDNGQAKKRKLGTPRIFTVIVVVVIALAIVAFVYLTGIQLTNSDSASFESILTASITVELTELPDEVSIGEPTIVDGTALATMPNLSELYLTVSNSENCENASVDELAAWMQAEYESSPERYLQEIEVSLEVYYDGQQWQCEDISKMLVREQVSGFLSLYLTDLDVIELELDLEALEALE